MKEKQHSRGKPALLTGVTGALAAALIAGGCGGGGNSGPGVPGVTPTPPAPANRGKIVFTSLRPTSTRPLGGIFVVNPDGSSPTFVADGGGGVWSPDKRRIVFTSSRGGNPEIYITDADGRNQIRLTNNPAYDLAPTWSPDGSKIAFVSDRDGQSDLYVMRSDGTGQRRLLARPNTDEANPAWSPDGTQIAFDSSNIPRSDRTETKTPKLPNKLPKTAGQIVVPVLFIVNADGSNVRQIGGEFTSNPAWQPNSSRLIYQTRTGLAIIDANGQNQKLLVEGCTDPVYSPDGSKIACVGSTANGSSEVFVLNADGTHPVNITNNPARDELPDWR